MTQSLDRSHDTIPRLQQNMKGGVKNVGGPKNGNPLKFVDHSHNFQTRR